MKIQQTKYIFWLALIAYTIFEITLYINNGTLAMYQGAFTAICGVLMTTGIIKTLRGENRNI